MDAPQHAGIDTGFDGAADGHAIGIFPTGRWPADAKGVYLAELGGRPEGGAVNGDRWWATLDV